MTLEKTFVFQYVILQHAFTKSGAKGLHSEKSTYAGNQLHNELRFEAACFSEFKQMLKMLNSQRSTNVSMDELFDSSE